MKSTRILMAVLFLGLASCGGGGPDVSPCADFVGSCGATAGGSCVDYGGNLDVPLSQEACTQGGSATWSSSPCKQSGSVGACVFELGGTCSAQWYFAPFSAAQAESACVSGGGTWVP